MSQDLLKNPLSEPWTFGVTKDGRVFFVNDDKKITTWLHPDTGQPVMTGFHQSSDLPAGWEQGFLNDGSVFFIDHNKQTTTLHHPKNRTNSFSSDQPKVNEFPKKKQRSSSFRETITKPLLRFSSFQDKRSMFSRRHNSSRHKSGAQRDKQSSVRLSGWLFKRDHSGMSAVKLWRKRWFVLSDLCLFYYKDNKEEEVLGSIVLPSYQVSTINSDGKINRKYAFKVEHSGMRSLLLSAESYKDMAKWVSELTKLCDLSSTSKLSNSPKRLIDGKTRSDKFNGEQSYEERDHKRSNDGYTNQEHSLSYDDRPLPKQLTDKSWNNSKDQVPSHCHVRTHPGTNANYSQMSLTSSSRTGKSSSSISSQPERSERLSLIDKQYSTLQAFHNYPQDLYESAPQQRRNLPNNHMSRKNSLKKLEKWVEFQKEKQKRNGSSSNTKRSNGGLDDSVSSIVSSSIRSNHQLLLYGREKRPTKPMINSATLPLANTNYEVKEIDVRGKKGQQFRAFAISSRCLTKPVIDVSPEKVNNAEETENEEQRFYHSNGQKNQLSDTHSSIYSNKDASVEMKSDDDVFMTENSNTATRRWRPDSPNESQVSAVDSLTAATLPRNPRSLAFSTSNLSRAKSASERLLANSNGKVRSLQDLNDVKRIQRQINRNRLRTLTRDYHPSGDSPISYVEPTMSRMHVGGDVQMAIKTQKMPKVLRRVKQDMHHYNVDADQQHSDVMSDDVAGSDLHSLDDNISNFREVDVEPEDMQIDIDLSNQLVIPNKIDIPDRLVEYEDVELSPEQEFEKQKKIRAIENLLSKSGQPALQPPVHLAASLAAEAGSIARAVAYQAQQNKEYHPSYV